MIRRRLLSPLVRRLGDLVDDSIPPELLHKFLRRRLLQVITSADQFTNIPDPATRQELWRARWLAGRLGFLPALGGDLPGFLPEVGSLTLTDSLDWLKSQPKGLIASSRGLLRRGPAHLLQILAEQPNHPLLSQNLESLLRHVEIKRQACLSLDPPAGVSSTWLEKHQVSLLFSLAARQRLDLRLLNAAFKLNDWAFPHHQSTELTPVLARYLLALAEAEYTFQELAL